MPRLNKTGPFSMGLGTGRGFGPCLGFEPYHTPHMGRGLGRFFGWGWQQNKTDQKKVLADYKKALEEELEDVKSQENDLK